MEEVNMVQCAQKCVNQKDGYCSIQGVQRITNSVDTSCPYFSDQHIQKEHEDS